MVMLLLLLLLLFTSISPPDSEIWIRRTLFWSRNENELRDKKYEKFNWNEEDWNTDPLTHLPPHLFRSLKNCDYRVQNIPNKLCTLLLCHRGHWRVNGSRGSTGDMDGGQGAWRVTWMEGKERDMSVTEPCGLSYSPIDVRLVWLHCSTRVQVGNIGDQHWMIFYRTPIVRGKYADYSRDRWHI